MKSQDIIQETEAFVRMHLADAEAGHNWDHIRRVRAMAMEIASTIETADTLVVELGALLHDISDAKFNGGDETRGSVIAARWLDDKGISASAKEKIINILRYVSFKGGRNICPEPFIELHIVQDADRLDAIGAIGIARTFHYGGYKNRPMYDPDIPPKQNMTVEEYRKSDAPTINHFYEKLLLLKDRMHTVRGKELAQQRHEFMEDFLAHFLNEWKSIL